MWQVHRFRINRYQLLVDCDKITEPVPLTDDNRIVVVLPCRIEISLRA